MRWIQNAQTEAGITRREFEITEDGRRIPGVLFMPPQIPVPTPVVLVQHGGSQHKLADSVIDLARLLVAKRGFALVAIDGPVHGARRADWSRGHQSQASASDFRTLWRSESNEIDAIVSDWRSVIDELGAIRNLDINAIGFVGLSMGTAFGLPLLAAEPRIAAAVVGMWGADYPNSERVASDAANVTCSVLFQQKWSDEVMTRDGQAMLFDKIGTTDKRLRAYPGGHGDPKEEQLADIEQFLVLKLTRAQQGARRKNGVTYSPPLQDLESRISRFASLTPTVTRQQKENAIPPELYEQVSAHRTYVFMAPRGLGGPISGGAGVTGGDNGEVFRVGIAICPPGNGPALHAHMNTYETFINIKGRWEIRWGDEGEHNTTLDLYDIFACPPGIMRTFKNIGDDEAHLMVIIQGERDAFDDVYIDSATRARLVTQFGEDLISSVGDAGVRFIDEVRGGERAAAE